MKFNWKLTLIIILAAFLRLYQLGNVPPSLDWDEVSLAYNAKALLQTGRDEYGNSWPITIRSFNDYKPALYTYSLIPLFAIFGTADWVIRLPSALAGILTVLATYFLVKELFPSESVRPFRQGSSLGSNPNETLALITSLLLTISPWHSHFSRVAFEANLALMFFVTGSLMFLKSLRQPKWLPLSALSYGMSMMAYHSTKLVIPLFVIIVGYPHIKTLIKDRRPFIIAGIISLIFLSLIGRTIQLGVGQSRLNTVSFTTIDNLLDPSRQRIEADNYSLITRMINHRYLVYAKEIVGGYLDHFDLKFWFIEGDSIRRLTYVSDMGLIYWWELPFLFIGFLSIVKLPPNSKKILTTWFLIAPAASALTSGTPNAIRSIYFLPAFQTVAGVGLLQAISWLRKYSLPIKIMVTLTSVSVIVINIGIYFHNYYTHAIAETSSEWQYGYKQMIRRVMTEKRKYDQVIITNAYDQPYIYALWYGNYSPQKWVNNGEFAHGFDNFRFRSIHWEEDKLLPHTLIVGTADEIKDKDKAIWSINFLDNSPAFLAVPSL